MKGAFALTFVLACSPEPSSTVVEVPPPQPLPSPPPQAASALSPVIQAQPQGTCAPPPSPAGCTEVARVRVGAIEMTSPSCSIDARVREGDVGSVVRCPSGAMVRFARATFGGDFHDGVLVACTVTTFRYGGCTWGSMQRITGVGGKFTFIYGEVPVSGDHCTGDPCNADAALEVLP